MKASFNQGLGVCAAEGFENAEENFDLSELHRRRYFDAGKGLSTPQNVHFLEHFLLPRRLLGRENKLSRHLTSKMPQLGVILGETGDPERLSSMAAMNAVLLKSRSGYPPSASMTELWMALLRHIANQESTIRFLNV